MPSRNPSTQTFSIALDPPTSDATVRFRTSSERHYTIELRDHLLLGTWTDLNPSFPGSGSEMTVADPTAGPRRYYRLRIAVP